MRRVCAFHPHRLFVGQTAQAVKFVAKPLSLHHRLNEELDDGRPMSSITFKGQFTLNMMHEWVQLCLPMIPPRIQTESVKVSTKEAAQP